MLDEPLRATEVRRLLNALLREGGTVRFSRHALDEMARDNLVEMDIHNILRAGTAREGELENGSWRYHIDTPRIVVVVAFRDAQTVVVVTAWRRG